MDKWKNIVNGASDWVSLKSILKLSQTFFLNPCIPLIFQEFLSQILLHLEKKEQHKLCEIFRRILENPPYLNLQYTKDNNVY